MGTITRFEDLEIWIEARRISKKLYDLIQANEEFKRDYRFESQILAAIGSVMDNAAEGFERGGTKEFKQFLSIAKGSVGEVRSQVYRAYDFGYFDQENFESLLLELPNLSGKISNFITYLSKTEIKGNKYK